MEREYSRQALYEQVWAQPKTIVAKSLGISDVYLGKICRGLDIPVPPRGYWALLKAEKSPHRIPLPPRGLGRLIVSILAASNTGTSENPLVTFLHYPASQSRSTRW